MSQSQDQSQSPGQAPGLPLPPAFGPGFGAFRAHPLCTKQAMLALALQHEQADRVEQGSYGELDPHWTACAVGCTVRSMVALAGPGLAPELVPENWNGRLREADKSHWTEFDRAWLSPGRFRKFYPLYLNIPEGLSYLEEEIFEALQDDSLIQTWPRKFLEAIPEGADLSGVGEVWGIKAAVALDMPAEKWPQIVNFPSSAVYSLREAGVSPSQQAEILLQILSEAPNAEG